MEDKPVPAREIMGYANHKALSMPFPLFASANAWWTDIPRVEMLFEGCARFKIVRRAMVFAHITKDQYYYFYEIHPHFSDAFDELMHYRHNVLIDKINASKDWHAAQFQLQVELPEEFGTHLALGAPQGAVASLTDEAFLDNEGKIVMKRKTAKLLGYGQPVEGN